MKALFLAGGMGTRLRPLTDRVPKPMVPVMGKPLLEWNIERLKSNGVDEVVLCTCYRKEDFEDYFSRSADGLPVHYVTEDTPLGTGGAIKNAQRYVDREAFLIFNADIVSDIDVRKMLRFHKRKKADVTIASTYVEDPTQYGVIEFDGDYAIRFKEKPQPHEIISHYINAGVYVFEPDVLNMISSGRAVSVEREVFPKLLENGKRIAIYKDCNYWLDLGTPEKYMQLHRDIFEGRCLICGTDFGAELVAGRNTARVHASAVLRGPVFLGEGAQVEAGAVVGPNAVVGAHSIVGKKCVVENSILWDNVELGRNAQVINSVITADCSVEGGLKLTNAIYAGEAQKSLDVLQMGMEKAMVGNMLKVAFLSTYPPRQCGIATFTQDLVTELNKIHGMNAVVAAINDEPYSYGSEVLFAFPQQNRDSYAQAAQQLGDSDVDVLSVQHEYGIFGGEWGEYLLELLDRTKLPIVTTLHTVLSEPEDRQKRIIQVLCQKSAVVIVMADNSIPVLEQVYGVDSSRIKRIHHGVPRIDLPSRDALKKEIGLEGRAVISTFGLISPAKGLEYGIEAISQVTRKHPDVLYLILGQTHPVVKRQFGEAYRSGLEKLVKERGLEENIQFVNKYLSKEELIRYLKLSDIYVTPYLGREQAVSGTLAYAVGYGRAIVSTPYAYAKEMLAGGRGLLADFKDADSLAKHISFLLEHPDERKKMEERTLQIGKHMMWDQTARQYADVFAAVCGKDSTSQG